MAIYGRFGGEVTIERLAVLEDVQKFDHRKPDSQDRKLLDMGSYVIVKFIDDGKEQLYALPYLRADGGFGEIMDAVDKKKP